MCDVVRCVEVRYGSMHPDKMRRKGHLGTDGIGGLTAAESCKPQSLKSIEKLEKVWLIYVYHCKITN